MKNAEWISGDPKVMKIDKYGLGTAISEGDANIILKEKIIKRNNFDINFSKKNI